MANAPRFELTRSHVPAPPVPVLDAAQQRVRDHDRGVLKVLAGPGTGKTTALVESVVDRVANRGVPVEHVLLLTFSRPAAGELRDRVTARLRRTISQPVARTFHSYAFGLLRRSAALSGQPTPRLLSGSEQDVVLRELLAGRVLDGVDEWPAELAAARQTEAFADELRELLMRAIERDVSPRRLAQLAARQHRPQWRAAADVLRQYLDVTALKAPGAFDAAELIQRATDELQRNPRLLEAERAARRRIFVDEYQDTDPAQAQLLRLVAGGADELVLIGDPDQAIYAFRGAEQNSMADIESSFAGAAGGRCETVALGTCRRSGPTLLAASRRIAARLTGPAQHRSLAADERLPPGAVDVAVFAAASQQSAHIASVLRQAHLRDGVAWSRMAVLVRATGPATDALRRGLAAAGVPVGQAVRGALADEPVVAQLLTMLRCVARPDSLTEDEAEAMLTGPVGHADPLQIQRIRRHLRAGERPLTLADLIIEPGALALVPATARRPAERVRAVLAAGADSVAAGAPAEDVLWQVWQASGLAERLRRRSLAGGADGARADRGLDAALALFAEAERLSERSPGSGVGQLHDWIRQLHIADPETARRDEAGEVVEILTAHASKGLEWDVVCVAGVQDGAWPNLRQRGSLLGAELLVDVLARRAPESSGLSAQRLVEERRLFYVAITRARLRLLVTAVSNEDEQPSRFIEELAPLPPTIEQRPVTTSPRRFVLSSLVAELRAALAEPDLPVRDRSAAAAQLARLAAAGVPGAHPDQWWGLAEVSSSGPIRDPALGPVPVRPSKFAAYAECELSALFGELGAIDEPDAVAASLGTLIHSVAEQAGDSASVAELTEALERGWSELEFGAPWHGVGERARAQRMLVALHDWLVDSRAEYTLLGREQPFRVQVGDAQLSGAVDRLERDRAGRLVVVDLKTGKAKPSKAEVAAHPQLAAYQLAVSEGAFTDGRGVESGGAVLVQVGAPTPGSQRQPPMSEFSDPDWVRAELARIAQVLRGNTVTARPGKACARCAVRLSCPAQPEGRQVTQ